MKISDSAVSLIKRTKLIQEKGKITGAEYAYQADCDGDWEDIRVDFVEGKGTVLCITELDTQKNQIYAQRVYFVHFELQTRRAAEESVHSPGLVAPIAAAGRELDIPFAAPVMQLHSKAPLRCASPFCCTTYTRTGGFCRVGKFQILALWRAKIRLFCSPLKAFVPPPNNPFQQTAAAKGITH